jgi:hypothetical protein
VTDGPPRPEAGAPTGERAGEQAREAARQRGRGERDKVSLRLDPAVRDALAHWASDELRSTNAQIEFLLRRALTEASRMPGNAGRMRRPGRPPKERKSHGAA